MNTYIIKYKISTLAELMKPFSYCGYDFGPYDNNEWWSCDAWVASKTIQASHAGIARHDFANGLMPLIDRFAVISQCAFRFNANSYVIYKQNYNEEKVFFIHYVKKSEPVGLQFDENEISQLGKISNVSNKGGLFFIMEAANASTYYTRLIMLIIGIEGLAGQIAVNNQVRTNPLVLKEILGKELNKKLYSYRFGLRNKLFHGDLFNGNMEDHSRFDGLVEELYKKIIAYLKKKYEIQLTEDVVHPQRNFHENYEFTNQYLQFKGESNLDLRTIEAEVTTLLDHDPQDSELITFCRNSPMNY
jgi:hypothetical protein